MTFSKTAYRTMTPFDGGLSPLSDKSKPVPLFGNTPLLQDLINGNKEGFDDINGRGSWSSEKQEDTSFHEKGDEYRLDETLRKLDQERATGRKNMQTWVAEMDDGSQYEFPSQDVAKFQLRVIGKPFKRLFRRKAAKTDIVSRIVDGCVGVVTRTPDGKGGVGAAFCVGEGKFLTCAHVIAAYDIGVEKDMSKITNPAISIELSRGDQKAKAKVIAVSMEKDVALLEADLPSEILELSSSRKHAVGEDVIVVGSPKGYENNVSEGIIGGLDRVVFAHDGAPLHIFTDAKILPGNSGGPMVCISDGTVVGMIEIIVGEGDVYGLNAAIASEYLADALKGTQISMEK